MCSRGTRLTVARLQEYNAEVEIWDPWVSPEECRREFGVACRREQPLGPFDGIVVSVAHDEFRRLGAAGTHAMGNANSVIHDIKGIFPRAETDGRL